MIQYEKPAVVQEVMDFAAATATAQEIEAWRVDLQSAEEDADALKEQLKCTQTFLELETAKGRVKELKGYISENTLSMTRGLANAGK